MAMLSYEHRLLLLLSTMFVLVLLLNTLLRDLKDSLAVNHLGADSLPSLKAWAVTPASFGSCLLYEALRARSSRATCFITVISAFATYFALFGFVLLPASSSTPYLDLRLQIGVFFVVAELWATVVVSLLFWNTATELVTFESAPRLFPKIGLLGQLGPIFAGQLLVFTTTNDGWVGVGQMLAAVALVCSVLIVLCYCWLPSKRCPAAARIAKPGTESWSDWWSRKATLLRDPHVRLVGVMVTAYGVSLNMIEVPWRASLGAVYHNDAAGYSTFMGKFWTWTGLVTACSMVASSIALPAWGFRVCVMCTPVVVLGSGATFFAAHVLDAQAAQRLTVLGAAQSLVSKACKYSMFDTTKQIAFLGVDLSIRDDAKALIEIVGYRWSKLIGAVLIDAIAKFSQSDHDASTMLTVTFSLFVVGWLLAAYRLGIHIAAKEKSAVQIHVDKDATLASPAKSKAS